MLNLRMVGTAEKYSLFRCENPLQRVWEEVLLLAEEPYLDRVWHSGEAHVLKPYVISSIKQSYQYMKASQVTEINVRPLLIYYSLLNLAKAILTIIKGKIPSSYHGLSNLEAADSLMDFSVAINNGIFHELGLALEYQCAIGQRLSLQDLCKRTIELGASFERYFPESSLIFPILVERFTNNIVLLNLPKAKVPIEYIEYIPGFTDDFSLNDALSTGEQWVYEIIKPRHTELNFIRDLNDNTINKYVDYSLYLDNQYWFQNGSGEYGRIPQPICYLGILFILSSIVRYHPTVIDANSQGNQSCRWFLHAVCEHSIRCLPNLLLNLAYGDRFKFCGFSGF